MDMLRIASTFDHLVYCDVVSRYSFKISDSELISYRMLKRIADFELDCELWLKVQNLEDLLANQSQVTVITQKHTEMQSPLL